MRVFLDTNVLVSAFATRGLCADVLRHVLADHQLAASEPARDPDDQWVLASAIAGAADLLVTGDKDLLELGGCAPLPILDPRGFWNLVRGP